ncbi:hypothetical protein [Oceanobacillus damuensis]|uniref:hypothetical protein n=1 Tax=Oceanobacillus damuensis TaxID=937928 RepID=UPI00082F136A|nr:hypothetical protein [Oceanobacillus damuensis]
MMVSIILVIILCIIGGILTWREAGKSDEDYDKSSKRNVTRLTWIYIITIGISLLALALYIYNL